MIETKFKKAFEEIYERDQSVDKNREQYWNFYYKLWKKLPYIKLLEAKMDEYERSPMSQRKYILQESDGHLIRVDNPYHVQRTTQNEIKNDINFCSNCGEKIQRDFTYCPKCGKNIK